MGRQIIRQPNDQLCLWSSIVDDFIIEDATKEEIIEFLVDELKVDVVRNVNRIVKALDVGEKPYHQFTLSYKDAKETNALRQTS